MPGSGAIRVVCAAGLILALSACEGVKRQFGLTKQSPDEFRVVARAPLSLPPDFTLRPPEPGAVRPQEGTPTQQARQAVFRTGQTKTQKTTQDTTLAARPVAATQGPSAGERSLLKAAGAQDTDPDIRALIEREADSLSNDKDFLEALVFWRDEALPGTVVDAEGESRRLRENSALGKDITAGETPSIERRKKALFEGLF